MVEKKCYIIIILSKQNTKKNIYYIFFIKTLANKIIKKWQDEFPERKFPKNTEIGLIAQEVKEVVPEVVDGESGHMSMDYGKLVSVLIGAVQELSEKLRIFEAKHTWAPNDLFYKNQFKSNFY